jgi:hypothetical protein
MAARSPALSWHFGIDLAKLRLNLLRRNACAHEIIRIAGDGLNFDHVA